MPCKTQMLFLDHPTKATDITLCILVERPLILMPYLAMLKFVCVIPEWKMSISGAVSSTQSLQGLSV